MAKRIAGFLQRIRESRKCGSTVDAIKYLAVFYAGRLHVHFPALIPKFALTLRAGHMKDVRVLARANGSDGFVFREVFLDGAYESDLLPKRAKRIIDLGGNCGYASIYFASRYRGAQIACVEAMPWNAEMCEKNFKANGMDVTLVPKAISANGEGVTMHVDRYDGRHTAVDRADTSTFTGQEIKIDGVSMDELLRALGWDQCDLLKVDIEGYERLLFQGSPEWLARVDTIVCELHPPYQMVDWASDLGPAFEVISIPRSGEPVFIAKKRNAAMHTLAKALA